MGHREKFGARPELALANTAGALALGQPDVAEIAGEVKPIVEGSGEDLPWLKNGSRVMLKRVTSALGPKIGGCGAVVSDRRGEGLRLIVIDWDGDAWPPGIQGIRDEIFPGRRMFAFSLKKTPGEYLELLNAMGGKCLTPPPESEGFA